MKTFVTISAVLAASQCMAEPSDPPSTTAGDAGTVAAKPGTGDAGSRVSPDASAAQAAERAKLIEVGPPPFTVPTKRIAWRGRKATLIAPAGARVREAASATEVYVGEGRNFRYRVAPHPHSFGNPVEVAARPDGAMVWQVGEHWFFRIDQPPYACWNDDLSRHDLDDVEMMIASCKSIEPAK